MMDTKKTVMETLRSIPGVVLVRELDEEDIIKIKKLEKMAEDNGAAGGLMTYVNKGVWSTLGRQHIMLMVADDNQGFREAPSAWTVMVDERGNVVGEWLCKEKIAEAQENKNATFISDDFVIYRDRPRYGECSFLMPTLPVPELDGVEGITNVMSGSVSAPADMYLKKLINVEENYWTILVGYDDSD
jgi:hypothetical protein